jgi:hypothetical protein
MILRLGLAALILMGAASSPAQTAPDLRVGVDVRRDRFTYHFDNPSSIDTPFLVPHFFEQRYVADNVWLTVTARYRAGAHWETTVGATPSRTATGDDYDTFFDPDGSVLIAGTTGGISIRSLEFSQGATLSGDGPISLLVGYRLRIDRSDFQLGHKTVTRNGVLVAATDVTTREYTHSQVHEVFVGGTFARPFGSGWQVSVGAEVAPTALARLAVDLPDKYPGRNLVFLAKVGAATARTALERRWDHWRLEVSADAGRTWSYSAAARLARDLLGVRLAFGGVW